MSRVVLYPYKMGSKGAKALANSLNIKRIRRDGKYRTRVGDVIINWGSGVKPTRVSEHAVILNRPEKVAIAGNKLLAYKAMKDDVSIPEFTTSKAKAEEWQGLGVDVVVRHILRGHSGAGVQIVKPDEPIPEAPLYTMYMKKRDEYRVHVVGDSVVDVIQKKLRAGSTGNNFQVRNFVNGWIFTREGLDVPPLVKEQAVKAVSALGLDFGAVDIGYNAHSGVATVYEVNTAPGLEGTTLTNYAFYLHGLLVNAYNTVQ